MASYILIARMCLQTSISVNEKKIEKTILVKYQNKHIFPSLKYFDVSYVTVHIYLNRPVLKITTPQ